MDILPTFATLFPKGMWLVDLFTHTDSVAHIVLLYAVVIAIGVYLGKVKLGGVSLGVSFVLFAGIAAGHIGFTAPAGILNFIQDFGLALFVFMIGLQVGPGFFASFRHGGVTMNTLAAVTILLNVLVMFACYHAFFDTSDPTSLPMMVGTMSGAVTNTPSLGASSEALTAIFSESEMPQLASGYACAYPLGVLGIIGGIVAIRFLCGVRLDEEEADLARADDENASGKPRLMTLEVANAYLEGKSLLKVHDFLNRDFVCSRILHGGHVSTPNRDTEFHVGDKVYIVCTEHDAEAIIAFIGPAVEVEWEEQDVPLVSRRIVVTNSRMNGRTLGKMHFSSVYGVNVTRVTRQGMEIFASPNLPLQVGDRVIVVGREDKVNRVEEMMGNSVKRLDAPNIATIFIGLFAGVVLGCLPISVPGMPVPLRLGIAGGPLIVAILIGRFGHMVRLVTYTTSSANLMLREIGLVLFLASVGVKAGAGFVDTVVQGDGLKYVCAGLIITVVPILVVGAVARLRCRLNYFEIMGLVSGTYTDPPALAYSSAVCSRDVPAVSYSTVYPLSMFLRIFTAQLIVLLFCA